MIINKQKVGSTNDVAFDLLKEKVVPFGTMIIADEQTKGRGRYNRDWKSEKGNLYCSIILYFDDFFDNLGKISFASSLAVAKTIEHFGIEKISLKWPNDVLIDGKKVSGVLIENSGEKHSAVVIGIGVNLQHHPELKDHYPATSVLKETNRKINPKDFAVLTRQYLLELLKLDAILIYKEWEKNSFFKKDQPINVNLKDKKIKGTFLGIDNKGYLKIKDEKGKEMTISAGDVFF